jgi:hypothetical protein
MMLFWFFLALLLLGALIACLAKQHFWRGIWAQKVRVPIPKVENRPVHPRLLYAPFSPESLPPPTAGPRSLREPGPMS